MGSVNSRSNNPLGIKYSSYTKSKYHNITDDRIKKTMEDYADSLAGVKVRKPSVPGSSQAQSRFGGNQNTAVAKVE